MSIEQKIQEILAESQLNEDEVLIDEETVDKGDGATDIDGENEDNARNNVDKEEIGGKNKTSNQANNDASAPESMCSVKEDVAALIEGEELTEEFKEKAATIFEAAVMNRVKQEVSRLDEAYEVKLAEQVEQIKEGLVDKIDGYLDYVVEQWMKQNEIALEYGMKSEILEGFVGGLKSLFEEHYIDVPEERYDVLGSLQEQVDNLRTKLDEQVAVNVELNGELAGHQVVSIINELSEGLVATDKEKFQTLVEELEFEGVESFTKKAQIIRESYFSGKVTPKITNYVVTDTPILTEETAKHVVPPQMKGYLSILDNLK